MGNRKDAMNGERRVGERVRDLLGRPDMDSYIRDAVGRSPEEARAEAKTALFAQFDARELLSRLCLAVVLLSDAMDEAKRDSRDSWEMNGAQNVQIATMKGWIIGGMAVAGFMGTIGGLAMTWLLRSAGG